MLLRTLRFSLLALAVATTACGDATAAATGPTGDVARTADAPALDVAAIDASASLAGPDEEEAWHFREPFRLSDINYCAAYDGEAEGEWFTVDGMLHERYAITRDAHGNLKIRVHVNPAMLQGTAWESGARYQVVGNYGYKDFEAPGFTYPITVRLDDVWHFVTPGGGNDFYVRRRGTVRFDEAGNITRDEFEHTVECR